MPALLSARPKHAVNERETDAQRPAFKQDVRPTASLAISTYVTPSHEMPRASQIDSLDLSASGSSSLSPSQPSKFKRPPTSPRKPREPAKRRTLNEVGDSDVDFDVDDDVDAYMTVLPEINEGVELAQTSPKDVRAQDVSDHEMSTDSEPNSSLSQPPISPTVLSGDIETSIVKKSRSPPGLIREDTPSFSEDYKTTIKQLSPPRARPVLSNVTPISSNSAVLPMPIPAKASTSIDDSSDDAAHLASLKKEHLQLKAEMTEIVEDDNRGMHCAEAKENKRRRDAIQAQLESLSEGNRKRLESQLENLKQKMIADVMNGIMPTEDLKRQVQTLTDKLKVLDDLPRPSSRASGVPSSPPPQTSKPSSGMLNEHNQLGPDRVRSPLQYPAIKTSSRLNGTSDRSSSPLVQQSYSSTDKGPAARSPRPQYAAPQAMERQFSEVQRSHDVIELISDDEETDHEITTNMGQAVDFDENDFSDGLDYADDAIEAQKARYEELTNRAQVNQDSVYGQIAQATSRRKMMSNDSRRGTLDSYMRPSQERTNGLVSSDNVPSRIRSTQATVISASPTQQVTPARPIGSQRIASTQAPTRVARATARPVDLLSLPGMDHPWSKDVVRAMNEVFKLRYFRANQLEAINATLSGEDAFVLMPTGGGKSLCYQLPSIIRTGTTRGVTVVVSPLVSLMQDQVDHLEALNIRATSFNSDKTVAERSAIMRQLVHDEIDCIYIAPEMLTKSDAINKVFKQLWQKETLARIVIDEAHCVSQWGHDFRPDYKKLGEFRQEYQGIPVIALTATANDKVQVDVKNHLGLKNPACFKQSFNRPNLHYYVYTRGKGSADKIKDLLDKTHRGQTGIIYCLSRAKCEALAAELGSRTAFYHAGMEKNERANVQRLWQAGRFQVIVATIAFGMGIDKPDVRFVIHMSLPKSLEGYYQETGRAGRDGQESICYLFWSFADKTSLEKMIDRGETDGQKISPAQKRVQKEAIQHVVDYADNKADCRRAQVLRFFNEPFDSNDCHQTCDNCQSSEVYTDQDVTEAAKIAVKIAKGVIEAGDTDRDRRATLADLVNIARGSKQARITDKCWDQIDGFGGLKSEARWDITNTNKLFQHLVAIGVLQDKHVPNAMGFTTTYCIPGPKAGAATANRLNVNLKIQSPRAKKPSVSRANSRQSRNTDMDDFIVDDDQVDDDFVTPSTTRAPAPAWPKDLHQFRHNTESPLALEKASNSMTAPPKKVNRQRDSYGEMMEKMYKRSFTSLDLDRIARCFADLKQKRNEIQMKQGHRRTDSTFSDQLLQDIAVALPITQAELEATPDVRRDIANLYGYQILCITNKYQEEIDGLGPIDVDAQNDIVVQATAKVQPSTSDSRPKQKRASKTIPNYKEPYFREPDDDESDYLQELDDEVPEVSPHFESGISSQTKSVSHGKTKRKSTFQKNGTTKPKTNSQTQSRAKASNGMRKSTGASGIGVAKPRQF